MPHPAVPALVLVLAACSVHLGALGAPFQFDDWWSIVDNPSVHSLSAWWQALPGIRPLLKLVNTLNWLLAPHAAGFRTLAIALHAGNALMLWVLLRRWLPALAPGWPRPGFAAFAAALLFALHPATTEAVTYASGRSILLSTSFVLAMLLCLPGPARLAADGRGGIGLGAMGAALCFALALAVRETTIVAPLLWLLLARAGGAPLRAAVRPLRACLLVLAIALVGIAATPGYHSFFAHSLQTRGPGLQLLGQLEAHAYLLGGPLPGLRLNIDPDLRVPVALAPRHLLLIAGFAVAAGLAWRQRRRQPWLLLVMAGYLLTLAPANSLLPRFDLANDRHLYPALGWVLIVPGLLLARLRPRALGTGLLVGLAIAAALRTQDRNQDYRSELALWQATVAASLAKARPWTNLGHARLQAGDAAGAAAAWRCALALDPAYRQAAWNLAALAPGSGPADPACPAAH